MSSIMPHKGSLKRNDIEGSQTLPQPSSEDTINESTAWLKDFEIGRSETWDLSYANHANELPIDHHGITTPILGAAAAPDLQVCPLCGETYPSGTRFCEDDGHVLHPVLSMRAFCDGHLSSTVLDHRYLLGETLAVSRTAWVIAAKHLYLKRDVAIKCVRPAFLADSKARKRLKREGAMAAALAHPNIVKVLDFGMHVSEVPYLVMERLQGETLADALDAGAVFGEADVLELGLQLTAALTFVHQRGTIHRDIKPSNVWLLSEPEGRLKCKLLDFGICKALGAGSDLEELTSPGAILGTPNYMSPEQCRGQKLDERADLYGLGVLLWSALMGYPPVRGRTDLEAMALHVTRETPAPSSLGVHISPALEAVVMRAMAKSPQNRFASAQEMFRALAAAQTNFEELT